MLIFGLVFILYFFKLLARKGLYVIPYFLLTALSIELLCSAFTVSFSSSVTELRYSKISTLKFGVRISQIWCRNPYYLFILDSKAQKFIAVLVLDTYCNFILISFIFQHLFLENFHVLQHSDSKKCQMTQIKVIFHQLFIYRI